MTKCKILASQHTTSFYFGMSCREDFGGMLIEASEFNFVLNHTGMEALTNAHIDLLQLCVLHTNNLDSRHSMSIPLKGILRILEKQIQLTRLHMSLVAQQLTGTV